ncbi:MAG: GNAT family N-acetyltransferase [Xanthomonadaceae bacterium]|nr:GNAT family N-acetyltransferase [Xanthomonadaceae bacterium]
MSRWLIEAGLTPTWVPERVLWHIRDRESTVLVARDQATLVGFAIMQFWDTTAHLNLLGVMPSRQRSGIGRQLLRWLEESAMTAGTFLIKLEVREANFAARRFYTSMGYRELGLVEGYYQGRDHAVRMSRDLTVAA